MSLLHGISILLVVGGLTLIAVSIYGLLAERSRDGINAELVDADRHVQREFDNARRAMNDAAGQSWRNLVN